MRAMVLERPGEPLRPKDAPDPHPSTGQVRIRVRVCGVCRTDVHIVDGELTDPTLPLVPGHQIVGVVEALGDRVDGVAIGDRVGVPWLGWACGKCRYCTTGRQNLCERALFTGYQLDGGYADTAVADARSCLALPDVFSDLQAAPLLCAGTIGFRALRMTGGATRLGFYGFGGAAHILTQVAVAEGRRVFAFTRPGDTATQTFARELGATWAGSSTEAPPSPLDAAILFAAAGELVPRALEAVEAGGTVVCAEIHMSDIPSFPYALLWKERVVRSVANLTWADGREFLAVAARVPVRTQVTTFPLDQANEAITALRGGGVNGAIVLQVAT
ncbi:MAG: zinc-dependent alcohol dehydrogenase family protein [Actinobacteria bacterium]|nr:MAG: zinc-dependent alcohol dehydrogenase family protein [Actinomycetota bacterium]